MSTSRRTISIFERPSPKGRSDAGLRAFDALPEPLGVTAIQVLCALADGEEEGVPEELARRLLANVEHVNVGDYLGRTPLFYAVLNGNAKLARFLLDNGADAECKLRYDVQQGINLRAEVAKHKAFLQQLPLHDFQTSIPPGRTPLHFAVKTGKIEIVKLLLHHKADVNSMDAKGTTPLLLAGCNSLKIYEEIVRLLITNGADVTKTDSTGTTPLYQSVHLGSYDTVKLLLQNGAWLSYTSYGETELHISALKGFSYILEIFLEDPRLKHSDINHADLFGRTPAYKAAYADQKDCLTLLINRGADLSLETKRGETVSDMIFRNVSDPMEFLKEKLNNCIEINDEKGICLVFDFLAPPSGRKQMDVLQSLFDVASKEEKLKILQHPLVEAFLNLKWIKVKPFFYFLLLGYIFFVLSLSIYVLILVKKFEYISVISISSTFVLTISAAGLLIHAIIQSVLMWKSLWHEFEIWMDVASTTIAFTLVILVKPKDFVSQSHEWVLHCTSIAVLLAWTKLMLLIGRFPNLGYYALMFGAVLLNVLKVLSTFICLIIGFALCFCIQFYEDETFENLWMALVKTTVMMVGEFDYVDLFSKLDSARLHVTARLIFFVFIIVVSIVLMNLMVGLAVSDIQGLQQESNAKRLEKQAKFLLQFEKVIDGAKVAKWRFLPVYLKRFLLKRKSIPLRFKIKSEWYIYQRKNDFYKQKLSPKLMESIEIIAKIRRRNGRNKIEFNEREIYSLLEKIKEFMETSRT